MPADLVTVGAVSRGSAPDGATKKGAEVSREEPSEDAFTKEGSPEAGQAWSWE